VAVLLLVTYEHVRGVEDVITIVDRDPTLFRNVWILVQLTQCYITEERNPQLHCRVNIKLC